MFRENAKRHGHALPRGRDGVTVVIGKNKMALKVHPKGEQQFAMEKQDRSSSIKDGTRVRAELNEAGSVIDVHPEKSGAGHCRINVRW